MTDSQASKALAEFAAEHGLSFPPEAEIPRQGSTLSREGAAVEAAASGALPGGIEGTLAHFSYVYTWTDSDNNRHSETRRFTLVVTRVPESIGFVPYLGFSGAASKFDEGAGGEDMAPIHMEKSEVLKKASASAYKGTRESWLAQLFSPALIQWLERCDEDFGFELATGVLCVGRMELRTSPSSWRRSAPTPPTSPGRSARSRSRRSEPAARSKRRATPTRTTRAWRRRWRRCRSTRPPTSSPPGLPSPPTCGAPRRCWAGRCAPACSGRCC